VISVVKKLFAHLFRHSRQLERGCGNDTKALTREAKLLPVVVQEITGVRLAGNIKGCPESKRTALHS
jgi:hypothetical protein